MTALERIVVREIRPSEIDAVLEFRNSVFTPITRPKWDAMGCTAIVARAGRRVIGAIPLQFRQMVLAKGVVAPVVCENAVGVAEEARSQGVGGRMIACAAEALADRADALFVHRVNERSAGYRFYRKTDHGDLLYIQTLLNESPSGRMNSVQALPWTEAVRRERGLLRCFRQSHAGYGGFQSREQGFFKLAIASHVYGNDECRLFVAEEGGRVGGYAIANPCCKLWPGLAVYDLAASSAGALRDVLDRVERHARDLGLPVSFPCNREHPYYPLFLKRGYCAQEDTPLLMARVIRPDRLFARWAGKSRLAASLRLEARTPHREVLLNAPKAATQEATLFMKESQLTRLLTGRLDFATSLSANLIRSTPMPARVEQALGRVFRFTPWRFNGLDFI